MLSPGSKINLLIRKDIDSFIPSGFFYLKSLDRSISIKRVVWPAFIITIFYQIPVFNASSVDPDLIYIVWQFPFCGINGLRLMTNRIISQLSVIDFS